MNRTSRWVLSVAGLAIVVGMPLAGDWFRSGRAGRCEFDGSALDSTFRARVVDRDARSHEFCSLACAEGWLARSSPPAAVYVTDETSGVELDVAEAWFVRSLVVTNRATGNRIHAFAREADAHAHAEAAGGTVLSGWPPDADSSSERTLRVNAPAN